MKSDRTRITRQNLTLKDEAIGDGGETSGSDLDQTAGDSLGFEVAEIDEVIRQIGKYECRMLLGKGGMGAVYLGFDPLIEREVAIKILPKTLSADETAISRFLAEARAIGQLNHPNVIAIYDIGKHDDHYFIVMELARGGNVSSLVKEQGGRVSFSDACHIALDAARGLQAAHSAGIVHRDVKPENLMLSADKQVKLVDFGLAKAIDRSEQLSITAPGQILGTPMYMAPEQIENGDIDARTDIYSWGATFCSLLTGKPPFDVDSITKVLFAHVGGPRPDPCEVDPSLPSACTNVIAKAMAIDPSERYETMTELIADLESLLEQDPAGSLSPVGTPAVDVATDSPRVLLIEPSKFLAKVTCEAFEEAGCANVFRLSTAEEALRCVENESIDVAISSRQLIDSSGEELLRSVRDSTGASQMMCVLTSSNSLGEMIAESDLEGPIAYVRKQAGLDETLRAIYVSTDHSFSELPFGEHVLDLAVTILSEGGSVPDDLRNWLSDIGVTDIDANSLGDLADNSLQDRDLIIWLDRSVATDREFAARLIGSIPQRAAGDDATVAIVSPGDSTPRLRAVKRSAFLATCDREFDRGRLERLLAIATKRGHEHR
jgi:serine/threonine protein kinase